MELPFEVSFSLSLLAIHSMTHMCKTTGETIPIRLFLGGFELTPTFRDVNKKFSTRYYLNLVLIDEENRRYFKQQEITIYRQDTREADASLAASGPAELGQNLEGERERMGNNPAIAAIEA
jgi:hypothetical protein